MELVRYIVLTALATSGHLAYGVLYFVLFLFLLPACPCWETQKLFFLPGTEPSLGGPEKNTENEQWFMHIYPFTWSYSIYFKGICKNQKSTLRGSHFHIAFCKLWVQILAQISVTMDWFCSSTFWHPADTCREIFPTDFKLFISWRIIQILPRRSVLYK
jgi:hypothetical protein